MFDDVANTIALSVTFSGLSSAATLFHIHVGPPGVSGPVIVNFVPFTPSATSGTITGGPLAFPTANIADLFAGNTYFNIHSSTFPGGEIRGALVPIPEPGTLTSTGFGVAILLVRAWKRRPNGARARSQSPD